MQNNYQLAGHLQTTGWNTTNDVNATNTFGMTPAEVALQAGDLKEFIQITSHPQFQTAKLGRVNLFLDISRQESEKHYQILKQYFNENFKYDDTQRTFVKLS